MIQVFNKDTALSFYSTTLDMLLFFCKPVTSLLQDSCFTAKQHILIQNKQKTTTRVKRIYVHGWLPFLFRRAALLLPFVCDWPELLPRTALDVTVEVE